MRPTVQIQVKKKTTWWSFHISAVLYILVIPNHIFFPKRNMRWMFIKKPSLSCVSRCNLLAVCIHVQQQTLHLEALALRWCWRLRWWFWWSELSHPYPHHMRSWPFYLRQQQVCFQAMVVWRLQRLRRWLWWTQLQWVWRLPFHSHFSLILCTHMVHIGSKKSPLSVTGRFNNHDLPTFLFPVPWPWLYPQLLCLWWRSGLSGWIWWERLW